MAVLESQGDSTSAPSAHVDTFVRDNLPPASDWPPLDFSGLPELRYPPRINCAVELLDRMVKAGHADRPAIHFEGTVVTYQQLLETANRIAHVLVEDLGVVPGNRVLLRGPNNPTMVASWFAVLKTGGVVVTTMPLLRARELSYILEKARVSVALCDSRLVEDMRAATERAAQPGGAHRVRVVYFGPDGPDSLEGLAAGQPSIFESVATAADDPALIAFTSGTTGQAKGAVHFHRDVLAVCDTFSRYVLQPHAEDVFTGTPPLAFTYGLGGLLLFPMRVGASSALIEKPTPETLLQALQDYRATTLFTSPTMYRTLVDLTPRYNLSSLKTCVSAGEPLPLPTYEAWLRATGIKIVDGIGSTEMLHIFISAAGDDIRPGSTGKVVPGYQACVVDEVGSLVHAGAVGRLAVRGPTGCRYLADPERQRAYVQNGWNLTGDAYMMDEDGYFWFQARTDDMIISAGYNIAGPEIENVLLEHPRVKECAVVASPDPERGNIVKAFVVLREPADATATTVAELQNFVKAELAPYKYPRAIEFMDSLPRTETGKLQRYKLRQMEVERAHGTRAGG
jgi:2-aminobenzoate-CoA ligase